MISVKMNRYRRFCRRNCLLITLILLVLGITWYRGTRKDVIQMSLPPMPQKLNQFLHESQNQLKESIKEILRTQNPASLLFSEHFTELNDDGSNLMWIHESDFHIPNKNDSSCMVDINSIADSDGYIKMDVLDSILKGGINGVHLALSSMRQAKVSLAALSTRPYSIRSPILISAKVLLGPNIEHCRREKFCPYVEPIVAESLLALMKADLRAQIGLSWMDYFDFSTVNQGYSWRNVIEMFELTREVRKGSLSQIIIARAALARNSLPQLNWLSEAAGTGLVIEASAADAKLQYLADDIALIYDILPKAKVFLRVPRSLREAVLKKKEAYPMPSDWQNYLVKSAYIDKEWMVLNEYDEKYFRRSAYAVLMYPAASHSAFIATTEHHTLAPRVITAVAGRVIFFEEDENIRHGKFTSGLKIYVDTLVEHVPNFGTVILIGSSGYISITSYSTRRDVIMSDHKLNQINPCYQFLIEIEPRGIDVMLTSPIDCNYPLVQKAKETLKLRLDITLSSKPFQFLVQTVGKEPVLLDQFRAMK